MGISFSPLSESLLDRSILLFTGVKLLTEAWIVLEVVVDGPLPPFFFEDTILIFFPAIPGRENIELLVVGGPVWVNETFTGGWEV